MTLDQKAVDRLNGLIERGTQVWRMIRDRSNADSEVSTIELFNQWQTSSSNLLIRVFGAGSVHHEAFVATRRYPINNKIPEVLEGNGVLRAAKDDLENGYLFDTRVLIEAEVFNDLLEQAEHLHGGGYHAPAAVIAGCVLEDGLRKACGRADIALPASPKLDWMNAELAKQGVYSKLVQKQVTALAGIRNEAAHGNWAAFTKDDVTGMISQVRTIMATYLS